jgi:hypothetical protein
MKTFARIAALAIVATAAFSGTSFARSTSASLTGDPNKPVHSGPTSSPIPTCPPGTGCTFPTSGQ